MKTCLLCDHENPEDAATCEKCGEASWMFASGSVVKPEPLSITNGQDENLDKPKRWRK